MEEIEGVTDNEVISGPQSGVLIWNGSTTAIVGAVGAIAAMSMYPILSNKQNSMGRRHHDTMTHLQYL